MTGSLELLVRYLRQRQELGDEDLILSPEAIRAIQRGPSIAPSAQSPGPSRTVTLEVTAAPTGAAAATPAPPARLVNLGPFEQVANEAASCTACGLARTRTNVVFGDGTPAAKLVVVGEAPGADEDRVGRPFVGRAGKLLDQLLLSIGFPRESVYICNVLKCRPPGNRNPQPEEVQACSHFLRRQLELIEPRAVLAVGTFSAQTLLGSTQPISKLRGTVHRYEGIPLVPTYHPAALLRNPSWIRPVWEDLQRLRRVIDAE